MGSRFRGNDTLRGSRRGAEAAEGHSPQRHAELVSASIVPHRPKGRDEKWTLNQVQGDGCGSGRHAVFYLVFDDRVEIVRVMHLASDFERWL
jgi:plasmid stabilization system protein ParE